MGVDLFSFFSKKISNWKQRIFYRKSSFPLQFQKRFLETTSFTNLRNPGYSLQLSLSAYPNLSYHLLLTGLTVKLSRPPVDKIPNRWAHLDGNNLTNPALTRISTSTYFPWNRNSVEYFLSSISIYYLTKKQETFDLSVACLAGNKHLFFINVVKCFLRIHFWCLFVDIEIIRLISNLFQLLLFCVKFSVYCAIVHVKKQHTKNKLFNGKKYFRV